jgi:osmoprotectant transport system ATP-binding protein
LSAGAGAVAVAAAFELRGVGKAYGGERALVSIDLDVERGKTTVLIGPSGCGKSTLLRLLVGLGTPDEGTVRFDGTPVTPATAMGLRRRMGYVIQDGGLLPHLDARGNVALMARYLGWDERRVLARMRELAELVRLPEGALARFPRQLSGGQRQRVGLMRALMLEPDALLLDEPMGALDPLVRADLQQDLRDIFGRLGKTVVLVTHDLGEAGFLGARVVLMQSGRVVQQGTLRELARAPVDPFVTRFINAQRAPLAALEEDA